MNNILETYEQVIYGDLRPWISENKEKKRFTDFLKPNFLEQGGACEDLNQLPQWMKNNPLYKGVERPYVEINEKENNVVEIGYGDMDDLIFNGLIDISIEPSFDDKTEFYYQLLQKENAIILIQINKILKDPNIDFSQFINKLYSQLKLYLTECHTKHKAIHLPGKHKPLFENPEDSISKEEYKERKSSKYILMVAKTRLMQLTLEIRSIFSPYISDEIETEDDIYHEVLHEQPPLVNALDSFNKLYKYRLKNFISNKEYDLKNVNELITDIKSNLELKYKYSDSKSKELKRKEELLDYILILENLILIKEYNLANNQINIDFLSNTKEMKSCLNCFKHNIQLQLEEHHLPKDRITLLNDEIELISSFQTKLQVAYTEFKPSLIRKAITWLTTEKEFYQANLKLDLKELSFAGIDKIKTNLTVTEIALLFRTLHDNKLIEVKNKTDLFQTISKVFSSKKQEDISANTIKNHFDAPDYKAIETWDIEFTNLRSTIRRIKQK